MSLKALAEEVLARLKSGENGHGTESGTRIEHVEQGDSCSTEGPSCSIPVEHDSWRKTAVNEPCSTVPIPRDGTCGTSLLDPVAAGLDRLRTMPAPRGADPAAWAAVVADAVQIVSNGWAAQALALGWSELDLFGAVTDPDGDPAADGLAVKLAGRRVMAISETFATVADDGGGRSFHYRGNSDGAVLLWDIGRRHG